MAVAEALFETIELGEIAQTAGETAFEIEEAGQAAETGFTLADGYKAAAVPAAGVGGATAVAKSPKTFWEALKEGFAHPLGGDTHANFAESFADSHTEKKGL